MPSSTSSSSHRLPKINYRSLSAWVVGVLVVSLLALGGFNAITDPYQVNRFAPALEIDRLSAYRRENTAVWASGEIGSILRSNEEKIDVLIVGDSRARSLTGEWQDGANRLVRTDDGTVILNAAFGGASLVETVDMANAVLDRIEPPRVIIFQAAVDDLLIERADRSIDGAIKVLDDPWRYFFSVQTSLRFFDQLGNSEIGGLRDPLEPISSPSGLTGDIDAESLEALTAPREATTFESLLAERRNNASFVAQQIQRGRLQELHTNIQDVINPFVQRHASDDVKVLLFIPPMHPKIEGDVVRDFGAYPEVFNRGLDHEAIVYDGLSFDLDSSVFTFNDAVHFKQSTILTYDMLSCALDGVSSLIGDENQSPCNGGVASGRGLSPVPADVPSLQVQRFDGAQAAEICVAEDQNFILSFTLENGEADVESANTDTTPQTPLRLGDFLISQISNGYAVRSGRTTQRIRVDTSQPARFDILVEQDSASVFLNGFLEASFDQRPEQLSRAQFGLGFRQRYWKGEVAIHGLAPVLSQDGDALELGDFTTPLCSGQE